MNDWGPARTKTVSWHDPAIGRASAARMPGHEFQHISLFRDGVRIAELFDARLVAIGEGSTRFECLPDESTYNPLGMVHGGVLCTLLDSAAGCAVHSRLPAGVTFSSIEIKVSFLSPASGTLEIEGRALRVGRQVAFAEAHARAAGGKLVGHATTSIALMRPEEPDIRPEHGRECQEIRPRAE